MSEELMVVTVTGHDRPGITAALTGIMAEAGVNIVEVDQSTLQDLLALYFLIDLDTASISREEVAGRLLYQAHEMNLELDFYPFRGHRTTSRELYALTYIPQVDRPGVLSALSSALLDAGVNIDSIRTLARREVRCRELIIDLSGKNVDEIKLMLLQTAQVEGIDIALEKEGIYRHNRRLLVLDMDSTLVDLEVIDEMGKKMGKGEEVARLTADAMHHGVNFSDSLVQRLELLAGMTVEQLKEIRDNIRLMPGAEDLLWTLKRLGYKIAVVSGGFTFFTDRLRQDLPIDYAFANKLVIEDGIITGKIEGDPIDKQGKARCVDLLAQAEGIHLEQIVAIGDGDNDALMLSRVGLGIAFNAKQPLRENANGTISSKNLKPVLYLLGATEDEVTSLLETL